MRFSVRLSTPARASHGPFALVLLAAVLTWVPSRVHAASGALTQNDVALSLYHSPDGVSWTAFTASDLAGFFGAHRCLCPDTLTAGVDLTSAGQAALGTSTLTVSFLLGESCFTSPASCLSLGQVSFSATQATAAPTFSSSLVFLSAAGSGTVDCGNLTAGSATLWALLAQDSTALSFAPTLAIPVITATVPAPTAVTAQPANQGILVTWKAPPDTSLVVGYQVLCLPRPVAAATAGYERCGLSSSTASTELLTPADATQLCSAAVSASTTSVRLTGLVNGTPYTVAVVAIDPSGGVSPLSPQAQATPQPTTGFFQKYKQDGGAATGCSLSSSPLSGRAGRLWIVLAAMIFVRICRGRRRGRMGGGGTRAVLFLLAFSATAQAQISRSRESDDWAAETKKPTLALPPDWGVEIGFSPYRPAVDSEFSNGVHPYADTFSSSRHLLSEAEVARYLSHRFGTWGLGLRGGYYRVTGKAFLADGTRSGDDTSLRLIPFALSALYRADQVPGLDQIPLIPYAKLGLDGVTWTASGTGGITSRSGFTLGWHVAAGLALGLNFLGLGSLNPGAIADPCALFFEWDYAAINGLAGSGSLHVGDSTWFAGIMFDL